MTRKTAELSVSFSGDAGAVEKNRRSDILSQAELARNAEIREEAVRLADEGKAQEAARLLDERTKQLQAAAPAAGAAAPKLQKEAGYFEELAESLLEIGSFSSSQRKAVLNDAYTQKNQQAPVSGDEDGEEED
jgi:Ca-activated chloride channel family protein